MIIIHTQSKPLQKTKSKDKRTLDVLTPNTNVDIGEFRRVTGPASRSSE